MSQIEVKVQNEPERSGEPPKQRKSGRFKAIVSAMVAIPTLIAAIIAAANYLPSLPFYPQARLTLTTLGQPFLSDPLSTNSVSSRWVPENPTAPGLCQFKNGAYYIESIEGNYAKRCLSAFVVHDFVLQVQMRIIEGDGGGLVFRDNASGDSYNYYYFFIRSDGWYGLNKSIYQNGKFDFRFLHQAFDPAINTGLNARNEMTVMMIGDTIYLFANGKYLTHFVDSPSLCEGQIGLAAGYIPSTVVFSNLKMWRL